MFCFFRVFFRDMGAERNIDIDIFNVSHRLALLETCCFGAVRQVNNSATIYGLVSWLSSREKLWEQTLAATEISLLELPHPEDVLKYLPFIWREVVLLLG